MEEREEPTIGDELASEIDDEGRNLTQQRLDEEGVEPRPVDFDWQDEPSDEETPD